LSVSINQDYPAYELFKEALPIIWKFSVAPFTLDKRISTEIGQNLARTWRAPTFLRK